MPSTTHSNLIRVPAITLSVAVVAATGGLGGLGAAAAWLAGVTPSTSGALGLIAALAGASAGIALWLMRSQATPLTAAMTQLFSATVRIFVGLAVAMTLLLATDADRVWLLGVFLVATLAGLAAELLVLTPVLKAVKIQSPPAPAPSIVPETAG